MEKKSANNLAWPLQFEQINSLEGAFKVLSTQDVIMLKTLQSPVVHSGTPGAEA